MIRNALFLNGFWMIGILAFLTMSVTVTHATAIIETVAGDGPGDSGIATQYLLPAPGGLALDQDGNLFIAAIGAGRVFKVTPDGLLTVFAGSGIRGFCGDGGLAVNACLAQPLGIALDSAGNLYIADNGNGYIRKVSAETGIITTVAGNGTFDFCGDGGVATDACFNTPIGMTVDVEGNLYIADSNNSRIRKVDVISGMMTTVAGNGSSDFLWRWGIGDKRLFEFSPMGGH